MLISKKNTDAIQNVVNYALDNEWDSIEELLGEGFEPKDTTLWQALVVDLALNGGTPPHIRMMNGLGLGIKISEEGVITNKGEYLS